MLVLRRGVVLAAGDPGGPMQELEVRLGGDRRPAVADVALVGAAQVGDDVIVNVAAPDIVHANLTRGLAGTGTPGAQAIKLAYTSLQHAVTPVEDGVPAESPLTLPTEAPVAVCLLHAQLAPLAWAFHRAAPGGRLGFVQTAGGALPGGMSDTVRLLRERGLLAGHLTAGPAYGGEAEALTTAGALQHGFADRYWHAAVCAPGPSAHDPGGRARDGGSALGHGGIVALDSAHAAAALGCQVVVCPRPAADAVSHPTRMLLELALVPLIVAHTAGRPRAGLGRHTWRRGEADLDAFAAGGLARGIEDDPGFFSAALAAGSVLAQCAA
jgi:Protein of unknown function (DUF3866)